MDRLNYRIRRGGTAVHLGPDPHERLKPPVLIERKPADVSSSKGSARARIWQSCLNGIGGGSRVLAARAITGVDLNGLPLVGAVIRDSAAVELTRSG
ncbi:hypothetical protein [Bradyrhizobium sp. SSUT112]|uniref:hypothetical protein n=1 Tax=Bradyrhizobium sp. SSUT112 TaxID=3040604 RepID=UPI00326767C2